MHAKHVATKPRRICRRSNSRQDGTELSAFHRYSTKSFQGSDTKLRSVCCCFQLNYLTQKVEQNGTHPLRTLFPPKARALSSLELHHKIFIRAVHVRLGKRKNRSSVEVRETKPTKIPSTSSSFCIPKLEFTPKTGAERGFVGGEVTRTVLASRYMIVTVAGEERCYHRPIHGCLNRRFFLASESSTHERK